MMLGKFGLLILAGFALLPAQPSDRNYKILQDEQVRSVNHEKSCESCLPFAPQAGDLTVDVLQVLDLPLNIHEAALTKTERGYLLRMSLGNSSDLKIIGL